MLGLMIIVIIARVMHRCGVCYWRRGDFVDEQGRAALGLVLEAVAVAAEVSEELLFRRVGFFDCDIEKKRDGLAPDSTATAPIKEIV